MSINRIGSLLAESVCEETRFGALPIGHSAPLRFYTGRRVRIQSGVFEGVEGTVVSYCSESRLIVAVDLDCRGVTIEIDERRLAHLDGC